MIDYFIENLTGIKNSQVKNAPKLEEALGRVEIEPEGNFHDLSLIHISEPTRH